MINCIDIPSAQEKVKSVIKLIIGMSAYVYYLCDMGVHYLCDMGPSEIYRQLNKLHTPALCYEKILQNCILHDTHGYTIGMMILRYLSLNCTNEIIIDREVREIMYLVPSVHLSVHPPVRLSPLSRLNCLTWCAAVDIKEQRAKKSHYQSMVFVCVSNNRVDAVVQLKITSEN